MTAMQQAFARAESQRKDQQPKKTYLELVWTYVKDHPNSFAQTISSRVYKHAHMTLMALEDRDMVVCAPQHNPKTQRMAKAYKVNPRMNGVYELWPASGKYDRKPESKVPPPLVPPLATLTAPPPQEPAPLVVKAQHYLAPVPDAIKNMTLAEAHSAYQYLKTLFEK